MKILTLNTHSLIEDHYTEKLTHFIHGIENIQPDIIALQEVNQSACAPPADGELLSGFLPCPENEIPLRRDNHAAQAARLLHQAGIPCQWTWIPAKLGYGIYDEGMALFSLGPAITETASFYISGCRDYQNWKTRRVLGMRTAQNHWFYTVHMGWWQDEEEPFLPQWKTLDHVLKQSCSGSTVWLLGDFNSPAEVRGQGYDQIQGSGWQDTFLLAKEKDNGITVRGVIDGWREFLDNPSQLSGMRIDHIWCSRNVPVLRSRTIFNGITEPVVSDHFGILIETEDN